MRLTALVESAQHVCCRYRLAAFGPHLRQAGHDLAIEPLPSHSWSWLRLRQTLRAADAVILQRKLLQRWQLTLLRRAARYLIYDLDDAVFLRDSYAPKGLHSPRRLRRFAALVQAVDAVTAGNVFLSERVSAQSSAPHVHIIPTCVELASYETAAHRLQGSGVQLVWIGSSSTLRGLESIRPLLEQIGAHCPGVSLKVICNRFPELASLPVERCPWSEAGECHELSAADIGVSWLPDDLWSRGKCGLKVLQYMAAGLPVIANPVGVQVEMIRHGENGYLAETPEQWIDAVRVLAGNPALRRRMGQAGRRRVERDFSVAAGAARWIELLNHWDPRRQVA